MEAHDVCSTSVLALTMQLHQAHELMLIKLWLIRMHYYLPFNSALRPGEGWGIKQVHINRFTGRPGPGAASTHAP